MQNTPRSGSTSENPGNMPTAGVQVKIHFILVDFQYFSTFEILIFFAISL